MVNGGEPRLRGCIGTLEARWLINGFKDYALNRYFQNTCALPLTYSGINGFKDYALNRFRFMYFMLMKHL